MDIGWIWDPPDHKRVGAWLQSTPSLTFSGHTPASARRPCPGTVCKRRMGRLTAYPTGPLQTNVVQMIQGFPGYDGENVSATPIRAFRFPKASGWHSSSFFSVCSFDGSTHFSYSEAVLFLPKCIVSRDHLKGDSHLSSYYPHAKRNGSLLVHRAGSRWTAASDQPILYR
jgi:hypothetical protein